MGAMMRAVDWSATPMGPVAGWPQSLRTALSMMLESRFAMAVAWGPELRVFYNDRCAPVLGAKHPQALGAPAAEIVPEIWDIVRPELEGVRRGVSFAVDDWLLPLGRSGYRESCWFSVSYSPIRDESGGIGGLLAVVAETTRRVEGERRLATLRELAAAAARARTPAQACADAAIVLARNPSDVPFAALYVLGEDGRTAQRLAHPGLPADHAAAPAVVDLDAPEADGWPIARVARRGAAEVVTDLPRRFGPLPGGPYPEPAHSAIVLPLARPGLPHPHGVLVAGISPRRALDDPYRGFFELAADHLATAIGNAHALEHQQRRAQALAELEALRWLPDPAPPRDAPPAERQPAGRGARIVIADDNAEMRNYLRRVLAPHWQVIAAEDGDAALAEIRREPPDLVVTDVMMPGLDGLALLAAVRADERTRELPVIMLSARPGDEPRVEGLAAGASDYLVKPFSARELVARVSSQLAAAAARRAAEQHRQTLERARHRAEAAAAELQEAMSLLDATLAAVPVGLSFFDRELRFLRINDTLARWNGWDPRRLPGQALADAVPPATYGWLAPRIREAFHTGRPSAPIEHTAPTLAGPGDPRHWLITFYPVRGALVGVLAVDVTDEVRAREALSRTVQYHEQFAAILGHDLRNPLNAILTTAQLLQRRATAEDTARLADRIVASGDRMRRMIDQILDLARVRVAGGLRLQPRPVDLGALCRHVLDELRAGHPGSSLELVTAGSLVGCWDEDRLAQVLSNLAANAIEHGAPSAPVRVRLDGCHPERVGIRVENQGTIPEPLLPLLFDPFRSAKHRSAKARGLGLGLYISHEIVAAHRGKLTVCSNPADGTCIQVELPKSEELAR